MTSAAASDTRVTSPRLAFLGVFSAALLGMTAIGATLPALPRYVTGPLGAGSVAVGVVIGAFAVGAVLTRPLSGRLADARGRRRVVVSGAAIMGLAGAALAIPLGIPGLIAARLLVGLGEALVFTGGAAWVVDMTPRTRRAQGIGLFGLSIWTGLSIGTVAGELLLSAGGFGAVWAFAAVAPFAGAVLASRVSEPPPASGGMRAEQAAVTTDGRPQRPALFPRAALRPGLSLGLASTGYATMAGFVVLHLAETGAASGAAVFTTFTAAVVGARLLAGRLPDRVGARPCAIAAGLAEAVGLALVATATGPVLAIAGALTMGAGFSLLYPALALLVVDGVPDDRRGAGLGTFTAFFDIGIGLGAPLAGAIAAVAGYPGAFLAAAALAAFAAAVVIRGAPPHAMDFGTVAPEAQVPIEARSRARDPRP